MIKISYVALAFELAERIPFRVDVDDRDLKLGKKVWEAEQEWVPYTIVIGERELSGEGILTVRPRVGDQVEMTLDELLDKLDHETSGKPRLRTNTPRSLTRRPIFVG